MESEREGQRLLELIARAGHLSYPSVHLLAGYQDYHGLPEI
jgi:hypothetical protein